MKKIFIILMISLSLSLPANAITFNFKDANLLDVIEGFALLVGKTFIVDPRVVGKVNVISTEEMNVSEAESMIHSILKVHGFVMQQQDNVIKIVPDQIMREGSLLVEVNSESPNDQIVTQLFRLKNIPVGDFISSVQPLLPSESSLVPLVNNNSLIITSNAFSVNKINRIISKIDEPNLTDTNIIKIENLNAIDVAKVLDRFFAVEKKQTGMNYLVPIFMVDKNTNSLIIKSHKNDTQEIKTLVDTLEDKNLIKDETQVIYLKHAQSDYLAETLRSLVEQTTETGETQEIKIQADKNLNALIIRGDLGTQKMLRNVIDKLDIARRQVLVEAVVADISDGDALALGISSLTGTLSGDLSTSLQLGTTNLLQFTENTVSDIVGIIDLLATNTTSDILSTPSLITIDNEEAEIIVGRNVPFKTGQFNDTNNTAFQTLERQDVGVTLRIKPQISDQDRIRLNILQEVSSIDPTVTSSNDTVTSKKSIKTNVVVNNKELIVIGGLIDEKMVEQENRVPLLGDIPILGGIFRNTSQVMEKRNLIIFIKTTIVDTPQAEDISDFTNSKYSQIEGLLNEDTSSFTIIPNISDISIEEHIQLAD
ncbi:hypothetical protein OA537_01515 [Pelagibacteraceae bacterium]|nr:hypothetical protein [Pelagibacteraceae bacterium]